MNQAPYLNIASRLTEMARLQPEKPAILSPTGAGGTTPIQYKEITFQELNSESDLFAAGLEQCGITKGVRVALMVPPGPDFFTLSFALFKVGAVLVLADPGMGVKNLGKCLKEAEPTAFIGILKAHMARLLLGWCKTVRTSILVGKGYVPGVSPLKSIRKKGRSKPPYTMRQPDEEDMAAILFTSGSTGVPKGVVYTHKIFSTQLKMLRQMYGIQPGEKDVPTFPLFALFDPALGMTAILPQMDFTQPAKADPQKIIAAIQQNRATNMFGSPALINRVGRYGKENAITLPSLKRAVSAGAPVVAGIMETFTSLLQPTTEIYTPYGATESLPVCSIGSNEILKDTQYQTEKGKGVCVGLPVQGATVTIIKITDDPIPTWNEDLKLKPGEIGEIAVQGEMVTREYFNRKDHTALAKILCPGTSDFYHRMGDTGYKDKHGRIWFCGRKAHRVITKKETLYTIPCEGVFNTHPDVFRTALVGVPSGSSQIPILCVELEKSAQHKDKTTITKELLSIGAKHTHTAMIQTTLFHHSFPVDVRHNAKIFREKLAVWAAAKLA